MPCKARTLHQYFCIGKYWERGGGGQWLGMGLLYPNRYEAIICLIHTLQAIKTGSGSRNEAARVGMLALLQNEVGYSHGQIATSLMPRPSCM